MTKALDTGPQVCQNPGMDTTTSTTPDWVAAEAHALATEWTQYFRSVTTAYEFAVASRGDNGTPAAVNQATIDLLAEWAGA
jgi:hypothetical protein